MDGQLGFTATGFLAIIGATWAGGFTITNRQHMIDTWRWIHTHTRRHQPTTPRVTFVIGTGPTPADAARQNTT